MRVFVAGGTGVLGRRLVPQLVGRGHEVTATTTSRAKLGLLSELHAVPHLSIRRKPRPKKQKRQAGPTVVQGPWQPPDSPPVSRDQAALAALLDKIHAHGMDSLTAQEREQLMVLRDRLRRR